MRIGDFELIWTTSNRRLLIGDFEQTFFEQATSNIIQTQFEERSLNERRFRGFPKKVLSTRMFS